MEAAGLCRDCSHARRVPTARGSVYVLCERSKTEPGFPRYPKLPVLECRGFRPAVNREPSGERLPER